jgi:hypothetical protein
MTASFVASSMANNALHNQVENSTEMNYSDASIHPQFLYPMAFFACARIAQLSQI